MLNERKDKGLQNTLRALSDPIRREILDLLKGGRMSAGDIVDHFEVTGASISRHLSVLKEADLIRDKREGKFIFYELNASVLEEIMLWITELKGDNDVAETKYREPDCFLYIDSFADSVRGTCVGEAARSHAHPLGCGRKGGRVQQSACGRAVHTFASSCPALDRLVDHGKG